METVVVLEYISMDLLNVKGVSSSVYESNLADGTDGTPCCGYEDMVSMKM